MQVQLLMSHDPSFWTASSAINSGTSTSFFGAHDGFQFGIECCGIKMEPGTISLQTWGGLYEKPVPGSILSISMLTGDLDRWDNPGRIGILPEITVFTFEKGRFENRGSRWRIEDENGGWRMDH